MKKITALLLLVTTLCQGQIKLSEQAEISVLTLGPWQGEVFTAFGHSAFRVHDPINRIDAAFNYGVFDFDRPNFYLNFARGNNVYMLGVSNYQHFEYAYISDNRYIHEQVLNLRMDQKQRLFDFLEWNARPENRDYLYDYFYDNCATKIPEVVLQVFGDSVTFDGSYITTDYSFRELTDLYLGEQPWGDLGIDVGLGLPTDKKATPYEYMFLPDYVESGFAHATILQQGKAEPLVKETNIIYESFQEQDSQGMFHPLLVFSLFLLLTVLVSYRDLKRHKLTMFFDGVMFTIIGLLGLCLLLLWTATNHHAAAKNLNLLWALPTHLVAVIAFIRQPKWLKRYFLIVCVLSVIVLISWPLLPQKLHYSLIPFVMAISLRAFTQYRIRKPGS
ncbi:MAG TPA: DUF4105 domain-containing protein [Chryseosolibacter sp.]